MDRASQTRRRPAPAPSSAVEPSGQYVYCVARASEEVNLGAIGIEGSAVYTVAQSDLCAVVHDCAAHPYQSHDAEVVAAWVLAHHRVVDAAWKRWGAVLPLRFNTVISGGSVGAREALRVWLATTSSLRPRLDALAGKAEYGVQVFWDIKRVSKEVAQASPEIRAIEQEIASSSRGAAYMYRQRVERLLKREIESRATDVVEAVYARLARCADNIHVEKTTRCGEERQMLMNLSCLVSAETCPTLEGELKTVAETDGYSVRVAGPLPPYSFC